MHITSNGSVFSLELLFAFLACSMILVFSLNQESAMLLESSQGLKGFFLEEKAVMIADSLVKNSNPENPLLGSAFFDSEKHRIIPNLLDYSALKQAKPFAFGKIKVLELSLQRKNSLPELIFSNPLPSGNCVSLRRFVLLQDTLEKAIVGVIACE